MNCKIEGCNTKHYSKGMCQKHYQAARRRSAGMKEVGIIPTYLAAHQRVYVLRGKAKQHQCKCGKPAIDWAYNHSGIEEAVGDWYGRQATFSLDPNQYEPLCRSCHKTTDNRYKRELAA